MVAVVLEPDVCLRLDVDRFRPMLRGHDNGLSAGPVLRRSDVHC